MVCCCAVLGEVQSRSHLSVDIVVAFLLALLLQLGKDQLHGAQLQAKCATREDMSVIHVWSKAKAKPAQCQG